MAVDLGKLIDSINDASPASKHAAITPSTTALSPLPKCLYVAVAGDLVIEDSAGTTVTYEDVPVGIFPFRPTKVKSGTTATVLRWDGN